MKTHLKVGPKDSPVLSACGKPDVKGTRILDKVDCKACMGTNYFVGLMPSWSHRQGTLMPKLVDQITRNKIIMENTLRKNLGLPPRCKNCKNDIRMMVMEGTGFCSMNCKETYEHLHKEKT